MPEVDATADKAEAAGNARRIAREEAEKSNREQSREQEQRAVDNKVTRDAVALEERRVVLLPFRGDLASGTRWKPWRASI